MQAITQKQIAEKLNVSRPTVGYGLSPNPEIRNRLKPETQELIRKTAQLMGYVPDRIARSLKTGRTHTIGVISSVSKTLLGADWLFAVTSELDQAGYKTTLACIQPGDAKREREHIKDLMSLRVDGLMVFNNPYDDPSYYEDLQAKGVPLVLLGRLLDPKTNRFLETENLSFVTANDFQGMYELTRHVLDLGHREIAYQVGSKALQFPGHRSNAFRHALHEAGVPIRPGWLMENEALLNRDTTRQFTHKLLQGELRPTAILYADDEMAFEGLHTILDLGLRVPEDISVTGFDDLPFSRLIRPELTTVRLPTTEIVREASRLLIAQIDGKLERLARHSSIKAPLIVRQSTGPVPSLSGKLAGK